MSHGHAMRSILGRARDPTRRFGAVVSRALALARATGIEPAFDAVDEIARIEPVRAQRRRGVLADLVAMHAGDDDLGIARQRDVPIFDLFRCAVGAAGNETRGSLEGLRSPHIDDDRMPIGAEGGVQIFCGNAVRR